MLYYNINIIEIYLFYCVCQFNIFIMPTLLKNWIQIYITYSSQYSVKLTYIVLKNISFGFLLYLRVLLLYFNVLDTIINCIGE